MDPGCQSTKMADLLRVPPLSLTVRVERVMFFNVVVVIGEGEICLFLVHIYWVFFPLFYERSHFLVLELTM